MDTVSRLAALALVLTASGCASISADDPSQTDLSPVATASCGEVQYPDIQFGSHLIGDADPPVPYSSTPPTSGWHRSGPAVFGVRTAPVDEPLQVNALEAGGVVVSHNGLGMQDVQLLDRFAEDYRGKVLVTPYESIDEGQIAIASWGAVQRCTGVDLGALHRYADTFIGPAVGS